MPEATRPTTITCAQCGAEKEVGQRGPIPAFCSTVCRLGNRSARRIEIECAHCGQPARVRVGARYCSSRCRNARSYQAAREDGRYEAALTRSREDAARRREANALPCPYCQGPMLPPKRTQCGKPDCKRAFNAERARAWHRNYTAATGKRYGTDRYREQAAEYNKRRREQQGHWRKQYPEAAALADARRRMLKQQANQGERFAPSDVYERDGWTCGLCRLPVDPGLAWPHPMSASVDHILPLSQGGSHTLANVQRAHLSCNSRKSDRIEFEMISEPAPGGAVESSDQAGSDIPHQDRREAL